MSHIYSSAKPSQEAVGHGKRTPAVTTLPKTGLTFFIRTERGLMAALRGPISLPMLLEAGYGVSPPGLGIGRHDPRLGWRHRHHSRPTAHDMIDEVRNAVSELVRKGRALNVRLVVESFSW